MRQTVGNEVTTQGDAAVVQAKSVTPSPSSERHFPQTLVAMDPPTLPAANLTVPPPEFRQFPAPQRSVPGHPRLRSRLRRILMFWRRGG
ncbi:hypothetical protein [Pseudonocardia sp. NPDC049635]|uniref:hypothetical protein n=1 Tax=Pseudonocardia sp. NPDC049635 TaxID=3155506 RepID=UPI0033E3AE82